MPIEILADATDKISAQDLDFDISYRGNDELGALCVSFEQMREALLQNNQRLWGMIEERRQLQASVAHDLRNPIAIIEGHAEYLKLNLPTGGMSQEKIYHIADNIEKAAKRLENYTESIRTINHLEELEAKCSVVDFPALFQKIAEDLRILVEPSGISFACENRVTEEVLGIDSQLLYRILENLVSNAARYAKSKIQVTFAMSMDRLTITVTDDGCGFSDKILQARYGQIPTDNRQDGHMGMGLMICRILSKKHGGDLKMENAESGGAIVKITLSV